LFQPAGKDGPLSKTVPQTTGGQKSKEPLIWEGQNNTIAKEV